MGFGPMNPIIIFFHCLFTLENQVLNNAIEIVSEQMHALRSSGLESAASEIHIGMNAGSEGAAFSELFPVKSKFVYHGTQCRNEVRTILMIEERMRTLNEESFCLYFHAKGCTHPPGDYLRTRWRQCMTKHLVTNWRKCVEDLKLVESVGCHFMTTPQTPPGQSIWAGNFFFSRASYLKTLPSIMLRDRIKLSGVDSMESRFESEVWHFNGPRMPTIKDYHGPMWNPGKIGTCNA